MIRRRQHRGYVLVLAILVLAAAGVMLAVAARACMGRLGLAADSQQQLQLRWAGISARDCILPLAEHAMEIAAEDGLPPSPHLRQALRLGDTDFTLVFTDEQAKANLNALARLKGPANLPAAVMRLQADRHVILQPEFSAAALTGEWVPGRRRISSLSEAFGSPPSRLLWSRGLDGPLLERLGCWGSGKVNIKRASRLVMREMLSAALSDAEALRIETLRRVDPACTLAMIAERLEMDRERTRRLRELATDRSRCHGLWVVGRGEARDWYRLYVQQDDDTGDAVSLSYAW